MESNKNGLSSRRWLYAALTGLVPACLEGILIFATDPLIDGWVLTQSVLFWFSCGFLVFLAQAEKNKVGVAVLLTLLLNIPWYIALTVVANHPDHLIPLVFASIIMGVVIGFLSKWLRR